MIIGISGKAGSGKDTVAIIIQYLVYIDKHYPLSTTLTDFIDSTSYKGKERLSDFKIVRFADSLKDFVCSILGCTREQLEDRDFKEKGLGDKWTTYGYANGFYSHSDNNPSHKIMDIVFCDKETYEEQARINWQTAYQIEHSPRTIMQRLGTEVARSIHPDFWVNALMRNYSDDPICPNWIITDVRFKNEVKSIIDRKGIIIRINRDSNLEKTFNHTSENQLDDYPFDYVINNNKSMLILATNVCNILKELKLIKPETKIWL